MPRMFQTESSAGMNPKNEFIQPSDAVFVVPVKQEPEEDDVIQPPASVFVVPVKQEPEEDPLAIDPLAVMYDKKLELKPIVSLVRLQIKEEPPNEESDVEEFKRNKHDFQVQNARMVHTPERTTIMYPDSKKGCFGGHLPSLMKLHIAGKLFCDGCNRGFATKEDLVKHKLQYSKEIQFQFSECENSFSQKQTLDIQTPTNDKRFQCNECKNGFSRKDYLADHMRIHTGEKPFQCHECKKYFSLRRCLSDHMRTHTAEKQFQCAECKKEYTRKSHLVNHMRTHTNYKPFQCNKCENKYYRKSYLTSHMRTHTDKKPFQCSKCGNKYSWETYLIKHMRTHIDYKPYQCSACEESFLKRHQLHDHVLRHAGGRVSTIRAKTYFPPTM